MSQQSKSYIGLSDRLFYLCMSIIGGAYVLLIVLLLLADAAYMVRGSGWHEMIFENPIVRALSKPEIRYSIVLSLISCTLAAILSVFVAVPIGWLLARLKFKGRNLIDAILDTPIVLPPLVVGLSLLILFQFWPFTSKIPGIGKSPNQLVVYQVPAGCYGTLMGRTGSGKTTLLEAIIGLKPVETGRIVLAGCDVTRANPAARGIGYVPQDGALFSTMTVREHLAFALEIRREKCADVEQRVGEPAELLGITYLLQRRPFGLSGGERQRVALGRALSFRPQILLLDEPLSAVDEGTRSEMYELLRRVQSESGVTALHVTHNPIEARELADAVFILKDGKIAKEES